MRKIYDFQNLPPSDPEKNDGELIVEIGSYIPAKQQIESFIQSGRNLQAARQGRYDFEGEVDEDFTDPTRSPGFDMADASQLLLQAEANISEARRIAEANAKAEKVSKEGSGNALIKADEAYASVATKGANATAVV